MSLWRLAGVTVWAACILTAIVGLQWPEMPEEQDHVFLTKVPDSLAAELIQFSGMRLAPGTVMRATGPDTRVEVRLSLKPVPGGWLNVRTNGTPMFVWRSFYIGNRVEDGEPFERLMEVEIKGLRSSEEP